MLFAGSLVEHAFEACSHLLLRIIKSPTHLTVFAMQFTDAKKINLQHHFWQFANDNQTLKPSSIDRISKSHILIVFSIIRRTSNLPMPAYLPIMYELIPYKYFGTKNETFGVTPISL